MEHFQCFALSVKLSLQKIKFFSTWAVKGIKSKNSIKYKTEEIWPRIIKGSSTGCLPIHVRIINTEISIQKKDWEAGRKVLAWLLEVWRIGTINNTKIEASKAKTPPNFFGIERRIAYANKKYHSGWMKGGNERVGWIKFFRVP